MYYIYKEENNVLNGAGIVLTLDDNIENIEVSEEIYQDFIVHPGKYIYKNKKITVDPEYNSKILQEAKEKKYNEANEGAKNFIESGCALYEISDNCHIEATDGNIGKLTAYVLAYMSGKISADETVQWNTKEDVTIDLNQAQIAEIIIGLGQIQANVWNVKFPFYVQQIKNAQTIEEVNSIEVSYEGENE